MRDSSSVHGGFVLLSFLFLEKRKLPHCLPSPSNPRASKYERNQSNLLALSAEYLHALHSNLASAFSLGTNTAFFCH